MLTGASGSWSRPCSGSCLRIRLLRCFIIAVMHCFAFRGLRSQDCLTSLVSMPYVLTDANISLLTEPPRANVWASSRPVVKMISSHRLSMRISGGWCIASHLRLIYISRIMDEISATIKQLRLPGM